MTDENHLEPGGRLALRVEDDEWRAYFALQETMDDAVLLASIKLILVERQDRKEAFMALMRDVVGDVMEEQTGQRPFWPKPPQPAPEHERKRRN